VYSEYNEVPPELMQGSRNEPELINEIELRLDRALSERALTYIESVEPFSDTTYEQLTQTVVTVVTSWNGSSNTCIARHRKDNEWTIKRTLNVEPIALGMKLARSVEIVGSPSAVRCKSMGPLFVQHVRHIEHPMTD
jgi:hypothetical protein